MCSFTAAHPFLFMRFSNSLIHESSPYLLQHAHNPVDWYPWGEAALQKAKQENKLILVSIGYSACHWCHVMEHESFEDEAVAAIMNEHYVCIKVDREERPDIDQVYMNAVQLINGQGGWPLNCIALPDQRPIYGGTYFRKEDWKNILQTVAGFYREKPAEAEEYAEKLTKGVQGVEKMMVLEREQAFSLADLQAIVEPWKRHLDFTEGGHNRAPKFPLPNNFLFFLRYTHLFKDEAISVSVRLSLEKMALGGIYDQLGGGFARYSVDGHWLVPHFEKMLYDNAQLIALYAEAYQWCGDPLYKSVIDQSIAFVNRELMAEEGYFYSALDADSEGVEGKFYTWTTTELKACLNAEEYAFATRYYQLNEAGNWPEEHTNILHRKWDDVTLAKELEMSLAELQAKINAINEKLFAVREQRIRPGLDDKALTSWNALMIMALVKAYQATGTKAYAEQAAQAGHFIWKQLWKENTLYRNYKNGKASIPGFLDDYAFLIQAYTLLYQADFQEHWLEKAKLLTERVLNTFHDADTQMFFYTASADLIARKHEIMDNVIPAANSAMANALLELGTILAEPAWIDRSRQMLVNVHPEMARYGSAYSNWAILLLAQVVPLKEVVLAGPDIESSKEKIQKPYHPQKVLLRATANSTLALVKGKEAANTRIYVCEQGSCQLPVDTVALALAQLV